MPGAGVRLRLRRSVLASGWLAGTAAVIALASPLAGSRLAVSGVSGTLWAQAQANPDSITARKNGPAVMFNVLANDVGLGKTLLSAQNSPRLACDDVAHSGDGSGDCTYTPPNFSGTESFTYFLQALSGSDTGTIIATITNDPPKAVDDAAETNEGEAVSLNVLANDSDPNGDPLSVTSLSPPSRRGAAVSCETDGDCMYTPPASFSGADTFDYTISDGDGGTDTGAVAITVTPSNRAPTAVNDTVSTVQDTPVNISVLSNDTDPDPGDAANLTVVSPADFLNGTADCTLSGNKVCRFSPTPGFAGGDGSFTYVARDDGGLESNRATVLIHVATAPPVNNPPDAVNDVATTSKDTPRNIAVLVNDTDPDGDPLTITVVSDPAHGTTAISGANVAYTPDPGFVGNDTFSYTISDGRGGTDTATVSVTVTDTPPPVNRPPNAVNDAASTPAGQARTLNVLANDTDLDGDPLTITGVSDPPHGTAAAVGGGNITYTPDPGFTGADAFTYTISDGQGGADNATVSISVTPVANQPPSAVINSPGGDVTIAPGQTVSFTGTGIDPDGTIVAFTWTFPGGTPASSAVEDPGNVTFAAAGTFTVTFNVVDNSGASDPTPAQRIIRVEEGAGGGDVLDVDRSSPGSAGRVDGHDVLFVLRAIESQDPRADVNGDGRVDREDVDRVVAALGDTR